MHHLDAPSVLKNKRKRNAWKCIFNITSLLHYSYTTIIVVYHIPKENTIHNSTDRLKTILYALYDLIPHIISHLNKRDDFLASLLFNGSKHSITLGLAMWVYFLENCELIDIILLLLPCNVNISFFPKRSFSLKFMISL